jgi:hypothetical protein
MIDQYLHWFQEKHAELPQQNRNGHGQKVRFMAFPCFPMFSLCVYLWFPMFFSPVVYDVPVFVPWF